MKYKKKSITLKEVEGTKYFLVYFPFILSQVNKPIRISYRLYL